MLTKQQGGGNALHRQSTDASNCEYAANRKHEVLCIVEICVLFEEQDPVDSLDSQQGKQRHKNRRERDREYSKKRLVGSHEIAPGGGSSWLYPQDSTYRARDPKCLIDRQDKEYVKES